MKSTQEKYTFEIGISRQEPDLNGLSESAFEDLFVVFQKMIAEQCLKFIKDNPGYLPREVKLNGITHILGIKERD